MNLITLNPYSREQQELVKNSKKEQDLKRIIEIHKFYSKEEYDEIKSKSNDILECLVAENKGEIVNYCIYTGTKDNRLIQMDLENIAQKDFLQKAEKYAFSVLDAHTISVFSKKPSQILENSGFENLGEEGGITTYIKEKEIDIVKNITRLM